MLRNIHIRDRDSTGFCRWTSGGQGKSRGGLLDLKGGLVRIIASAALLSGWGFSTVISVNRRVLWTLGCVRHGSGSGASVAGNHGASPSLNRLPNIRRLLTVKLCTSLEFLLSMLGVSRLVQEDQEDENDDTGEGKKHPGDGLGSPLELLLFVPLDCRVGWHFGLRTILVETELDIEVEGATLLTDQVFLVAADGGELGSNGDEGDCAPLLDIVHDLVDDSGGVILKPIEWYQLSKLFEGGRRLRLRLWIGLRPLTVVQLEHFANGLGLIAVGGHERSVVGHGVLRHILIIIVESEHEGAARASLWWHDENVVAETILWEFTVIEGARIRISVSFQPFGTELDLSSVLRGEFVDLGAADGELLGSTRAEGMNEFIPSLRKTW